MGTYRRGKTKKWYVDLRDGKGRRIRKSVGTSKKVARLVEKDLSVKIAKKEFLGIFEYRYGLGNLVYNAITYQRALGTGVAWSTLMAGALGISLLASAFYMISSGLREAIDPRRARRRV